MLRENGKPDYVLSTDCVLHYLETPKIGKEPATEIEQWLYLLLHAGKEDEKVKVLIDNNKYYKQAMKRYEYFVADEPSRLAYEARQKFLHDQASYLGDARREGRAEGLAEGRAEGLAEGERKKALESAEKLLPSGLSLEQIAEATGLSVKDVKGIASKLRRTDRQGIT